MKFVGFVALLQILLLEILYKVHHYFRRNANFTAIHYDLLGEMLILPLSTMICLGGGVWVLFGASCLLNPEALNFNHFQLISIYGKALKATEERVKELKSQQK